MFEVPDYFPLLSLYLSRVLDEIGLNELTVKRRRSCYLQREELENVGDQLAVCGRNTYCFGSQSEGTTTVGLKSDTDDLTCDLYLNAIQEESEAEDNKLNTFMLNFNTPPGYVNLQLYLKLEANRRHNIPILIPHTKLFSQLNYIGGKQSRHGPAFTHENPVLNSVHDRVPGIRCNSWPVQAKTWLNKRRPGHWPSYKMLQFAKSSGCFLVPVGHRLSSPESKDFEFRISPSLTERCLVFSFNMTQIKCYVMLKIISKLYLKPATTDGISSFHLKNVMFYIIENTRPNMWKEKYLLQCITTGLFVLLEFVIHGYCPNYIIPDENLFAGRITPVEQRKLVHILNLLIKSKGCFLFKLNTDEIGKILREQCTKQPVGQPCVNSYVTSNILCVGLKCSLHVRLQIEYLFSTNSDMLPKKPYRYDTSARGVFVAIRKTVCSIRSLRKSFTGETNCFQHAIMYTTPMYCSYLGSLMSSICICYNMAVPFEALFWFELGKHSDVTSSQLKLASAFFCSGNLNKTAEILLVIEERCRLSSILPLCGCWFRQLGCTPEFVENIFATRKPFNRLVAHCVMFSRQEYFCVPLALKYEMFKSDGEYFHTYEDRYLDMALIDSLPFLYYLQYITYKQLGENENMNRALDKFIDCCSQDLQPYHKMTACNLCGHCMELEQMPDMAIFFYIKSLNLRPKDNVAKWLLSLVLFKMLCCNTPVV